MGGDIQKALHAVKLFGKHEKLDYRDVKGFYKKLKITELDKK